MAEASASVPSPGLAGLRALARRLALDLSPDQMTERAALDRLLMQTHELGRRMPTAANMARIAHALSQTIELFFEGVPQPESRTPPSHAAISFPIGDVSGRELDIPRPPDGWPARPGARAAQAPRRARVVWKG